MTSALKHSKFFGRIAAASLLGFSMAACGAAGYSVGEVSTSEVSSSGGTTGSATTGGTGASCTTDTWNGYYKSFMATSCAFSGCHSAGATPPNLTVYANVTGASARIQAQVQSGAMPLSGGPLSQGAITRLITWLKCGAPQ